MEKVRCQRTGCNATFTEADNPDGSCTYHASFLMHGLGGSASNTHFIRDLYFMMARKSGVAARKGVTISTYFWRFQGCSVVEHWKEVPLLSTKYGSASIQRCKTGKHTTEKPVLAKAAVVAKKPIPSQAPATTASPIDVCSRCHQGFFCSDHGSQAKETIVKPSNILAENSRNLQEGAPAPAQKIVGINEPQICKGCGQTFKEKDNHDTACNYHPGPAVFHDRMRGWKCCDIHVKEFDEFIAIPPCTKGWHNADPVS